MKLGTKNSTFCSVYRVKVTELKNSNFRFVHRRIYGRMLLRPEILLCRVYRVKVTELKIGGISYVYVS